MPRIDGGTLVVAHNRVRHARLNCGCKLGVFSSLHQVVPDASPRSSPRSAASRAALSPRCLPLQALAEMTLKVLVGGVHQDEKLFCKTISAEGGPRKRAYHEEEEDLAAEDAAVKLKSLGCVEVGADWWLPALQQCQVGRSTNSNNAEG